MELRLPILSNIIKEFYNSKCTFQRQFGKVVNDQQKIITLSNKYKNFINNFDIKEKFITDKAPLNFRWIGFIKILFPNSKLYIDKRPQNNCLSMYKNLFEGCLNFT